LSGDERNETLLEILSRRDDELLPLFYEALQETGQKHVVNILRGLLLLLSVTININIFYSASGKHFSLRATLS